MQHRVELARDQHRFDGLMSGRRVSLNPGGGSNSTSSSISENHSIDLCGTPYSLSRMPRIQSMALTW